MDLETYTTIFNARGDDPNRAKMALKKDFIKEKLVWYNSCCKDLNIYMKINHPHFSVCCAPRNHPFNRKERCAHFIVSYGVVAALSVIGQLLLFAFIKVNNVNEWDYDGSMDWWYAMGLRQGIAVVLGVIKLIMNKFLVFCVVCPCCQKNKFKKNCCLRCLRRIVQWIGDFFVCSWALIILAIIGSNVFWSYYILAGENLDEFAILMLEYALLFGRIEIWTCIKALFFAMIKFWICWNKEKRNKKQKLNKLKVTYIDYELYVKGNQNVEIPEDYRPGRAYSVETIYGRSSTIGSASPQTGSPRPSSPSNASVTTPQSQETVYVDQNGNRIEMAPVSQPQIVYASQSPQPIQPTQTIYVDQNGNRIQMAPVSQPQIVYVQAPPSVASSVVSYK